MYLTCPQPHWVTSGRNEDMEEERAVQEDMKNHKRKHIRKNEEGGGRGRGVDDTADKKGGMADSLSLQEH